MWKISAPPFGEMVNCILPFMTTVDFFSQVLVATVADLLSHTNDITRLFASEGLVFQFVGVLSNKNFRSRRRRQISRSIWFAMITGSSANLPSSITATQYHLNHLAADKNRCKGPCHVLSLKTANIGQRNTTQYHQNHLAAGKELQGSMSCVRPKAAKQIP